MILQQNSAIVFSASSILLGIIVVTLSEPCEDKMYSTPRCPWISHVVHPTDIFLGYHAVSDLHA